ncbi:MAG: hypothetical protein GY839_16510 [candidate division Zixibacteria bacterium]|nr:hypothetical protein [candidate division Zixibacteria bacterium]
MKKIQNNRGHILVKLLISLISISVISTALLNVHLNAGQQIYYEDLSSLMSMQARSAFDRLGYHLKLAGYANTDNQRPIEIIKGEKSDKLVIWHNDVEISFYVESESDQSTLYESVDGSQRRVVDGATSLRLDMSIHNMMMVELILGHGDEHSPDGIISRSYSTSVRLENF